VIAITGEAAAAAATTEVAATKTASATVRACPRWLTKTDKSAAY
jgi:hypothetical protein